MPNNENNVNLNNIVYNLTKIENPHLKNALNERNEQKKFMFSFLLSSHKDYTAHIWIGSSRSDEHTDIKNYTETTYNDEHAESRRYGCSYTEDH